MAVVVFLVCSGFVAHDRFTWCLEVSWVALGLLVLAALAADRVRLTPLLRLGLMLHAFILIYGGIYTYEFVPLGDWMKDAFGFARNHYDRIGHFAQGFFPALLLREVFTRSRAANGVGWTELFVFLGCMAFTAFFELIEFGTALAFGQASNAYLGSQGDIWDAQWDMLFCGVGALASIFFLGPLHWRQLCRLFRV